MTFPKPADHPQQCQVCNGTGREQAAPLKSKANGFDVEYTQLVPCTNERWWQDDPDLDEHGYNRTTPVTYAHGRRIAAHEYELECRKHGREPDWPMFDAITGNLPSTG